MLILTQSSQGFLNINHFLSSQRRFTQQRTQSFFNDEKLRTAIIILMSVY